MSERARRTKLNEWESPEDPPCTSPRPSLPRNLPQWSQSEPYGGRTQSHLFPGQPLGCTRVTALCARVPYCVHLGADWAHVTNASFESFVHYCFVTQWPKCTLKYAWWFLPHRLEQTDTKFKYSLELGEGLRAGTLSRVSERSHNTTIYPILIIWHIFIAYFGKILFQVIA